MDITTNKLTMTFTNGTAAMKAKQSANDQLAAMIFEDYVYDAAKEFSESLVINNLDLLADAPVFIADDFMSVISAIVKEIATEPHIGAFSFAACGADDYTEAWVDGSYKDGLLTITTTFFPEGYSEYLLCPECGKPVVALDDLDPGKSYVCPECGEEIDFSSDAPQITIETVRIK